MLGVWLKFIVREQIEATKKCEITLSGWKVSDAKSTNLELVHSYDLIIELEGQTSHKWANYLLKSYSANPFFSSNESIQPE